MRVALYKSDCIAAGDQDTDYQRRENVSCISSCLQEPLPACFSKTSKILEEATHSQKKGKKMISMISIISIVFHDPQK